MNTPVASRLKKKCEVVSYLSANIYDKVCLLNGVEQLSGIPGRDLDVIPLCEGEDDSLIEFCRAILNDLDATWVIDMPPIWGKRLIGVWKEDFSYFELHLIPSLRMGPVTGEDVMPLRLEKGACNFYYDPWLYVFKNLAMKNMNRVLQRQTIWDKKKPDLFLRECVNKCIENNNNRINISFISEYLTNDTQRSMNLRFWGLLRFMLVFFLIKPLPAIRNISYSIYKKFTVYFSPCTPWFELSGSKSIDEVQRELIVIIGEVFPQILVKSQKLWWLRVRKMQAMQQLFVLYKSQSVEHFCLKVYGHDIQTIDRLVDSRDVAFEIMQAMARYNVHVSKPK